MSEDLVQLNWNNFDTYITDAVKNLRKDENLCDVTLVCEDGEIKAHRVILSAFSQFFSRVVGKTYNHVHPLLYLRGVSTRILANILDYMYLGVVKIVEEDLSEMLNLASDLKVCGLDSVGVTADIAEDGEVFFGEEEENLSVLGFQEEGKGLSLIDMELEAPPHDETNKDRILDGMLDNIVIDKIYPLEISDDKLDSVEVTADIAKDGEVFIKEEENLSDLDFEEEEKELSLIDIELEAPPNDDANMGFEEEEKELSLVDMVLEAPPHDYTSKDRILDGMLDNIVMRKKSKSSGGVFHECRVCKKALKNKQQLRIHAEIHVTGFKHTCHLCGNSFKTRHSLACHVHRQHKKEWNTEQVEIENNSA